MTNSPARSKVRGNPDFPIGPTSGRTTAHPPAAAVRACSDAVAGRTGGTSACREVRLARGNRQELTRRSFPRRSMSPVRRGGTVDAWRGRSPREHRLIEAPMLEILNQGRIDELGHVGPAVRRGTLHPRPPFRAALDRDRGGPGVAFGFTIDRSPTLSLIWRRPDLKLALLH